MKGVSEIITAVMIVIIIVALIAMFWTFLSGLFTTTSTTGSVQMSNISEKISSCITVDNVNGNKVYIRNCGDGVVNSGSMKVFMNELPFSVVMTPSSIGKGEMGIVGLGLYGLDYQDYYLKLMNPSTSISKLVEVYLGGDTTLVLDAKFNESSGITSQDSSGYGNIIYLGNEGSACGDGTCPARVAGKSGNALQFDGANDAAGVADSQSIRVGKTIQVDAWIKASVHTGHIMEIADRYTDSGQQPGWRFYLEDDGRLYMNVSGSSSRAVAIGTTDLIDNRWHYVIGSYNGTDVKVFVDGNLQGRVPYSGDIWNGTAEAGRYGMYIGVKKDCGCGGDTSGYFNGIIDELRVYSATDDPFKSLDVRMRQDE